jgi:Flp pilus assembly protein TadG
MMRSTPHSTPESRHASVRSAFRRGLERLRAAESGMAAVEFSLILPIMVLLWIGGVEVASALSVDRRCNNLAAAIGDLVARDKKMTPNKISAIFDIAPGAMFPYAATGTSMRITAVKMDEDGNATVAWSQAEGEHAAYADNADMNEIVPESLRVPDSQLIMSEAYTTYTPAVGYVITGELDLEDRMFFVPRLVAAVELCDNNEQNCRS